jgi:hypothetical protein
MASTYNTQVQAFPRICQFSIYGFSYLQLTEAPQKWKIKEINGS